MRIDPRLPQPSMGEQVVMEAERELITAQFNVDQQLPKVLLIIAAATEGFTQETGDVKLDTTFEIPIGIASTGSPTQPLPALETSSIEATVPVSPIVGGALAVAGVVMWGRNIVRRDRAYNKVGKD